MDIFSQFCKYVDDTIFSKDKMGSAGAFVIDSAFINEFCSQRKITEQALMKEVRRFLQTSIYGSYPRSDLSVKGILAIQLYAASQRSKSDGLTASNYRERLSQLLSIDISDLQEWFEYNQENYWNYLYGWCDRNYFDIEKCTPRKGPWRYVQYPMQQAEKVFTAEDLKYIACSFINASLHPDDDLTERTFWRTVKWDALGSYAGTRHARHILEEESFQEDARRQIYNYFLSWNGEYKENSRPGEFHDRDICIFLGNNGLEIRSSELDLLETLPLETLDKGSYRKKGIVRRDGLVLFRKDETYKEMWSETRYLEKDEEGLALVFKNSEYWYRYGSNAFKTFRYAVLVRVRDNVCYEELYSEPRAYEIAGGLKTGFRSYMKGGGPRIICSDGRPVWVDGVLQKDNNRIFDLRPLPEGRHRIKVRGYKAVEVNIVPDSVYYCSWQDSFTRWQIGRKAYWQPVQGSDGVTGFDLEPICQKTENSLPSDEPILESWARIFQDQRQKQHLPSANIAITMLNNMASYGNI